MKTTFKILFVLLLGIVISSSSCTKQKESEKKPEAKVKLPTVTTNVATEIKTTSFTIGGNVTDDGNAQVTARGVCYSRTETKPTLEKNDKITTDGLGTGKFTSKISGLLNGTKYYVRAYATNSKGTAYGKVVEVTTIQ